MFFTCCIGIARRKHYFNINQANIYKHIYIVYIMTLCYKYRNVMKRK